MVNEEDHLRIPVLEGNGLDFHRFGIRRIVTDSHIESKLEYAFDSM